MIDLPKGALFLKASFKRRAMAFQKLLLIYIDNDRFGTFSSLEYSVQFYLNKLFPYLSRLYKIERLTFDMYEIREHFCFDLISHKSVFCESTGLSKKGLQRFEKPTQNLIRILYWFCLTHMKWLPGLKICTKNFKKRFELNF